MMANAIFAAARTFRAMRAENRAKRIASASKRLAAIANEETAKAKRLRKQKTVRSKTRTNGRRSQRSAEAEVSKKPERPYDWVESGAVNCPMWRDEDTGEFVFGLRWKVSIDGRHRYRRTVSIEMFEDVVMAFRDLAARYAADERVPVGLRHRMREYYLYLKVLPACVDEGEAEATKNRTLNNGVNSLAVKQ